MKRIFLVVFMFLMFCSSAFGATTYDNYNPTADKILQPDGSIVSIISGTTWAAADAGRAALYKNAPVIAAKYLMPDGTIVNGVPINTAITGTATEGYCIKVATGGGFEYGECGTGGSASAASETVAGVSERCTDAEMTAGTKTDCDVTPANAKVELDKKQAAGSYAPAFGTLTNTKWCTTNGTTVACTENAPQPALGVVAGTLTNTYLCKYTSAGTVLSCDVDPATLGACPIFQLIDGHGATTNLTSTQVVCPSAVDNTGQSGANASVVWPTKSNAQGTTLQVATTVADTYTFAIDFGAAVAYLDGSHVTAYQYCGYAATQVVEGNFMAIRTVRSSTYGADGIAVEVTNGYGNGTCWN